MVERNRTAAVNPGDPLPAIQELITRTSYDVRGNVLSITDALGRKAFHSHIYDYANHNLRMESIDAGVRRIVLDASGKVTEQRDSKDALILHGYDDLNRPIRLWARDGDGQKLTLRERLEYGDGGTPAQPAADRTANRAGNRLGQVVRYLDEAGLLSFESYDFKGNWLEKTRRVVRDAVILAAFNGPGFKIEAFRVDWTSVDNGLLEAAEFTSSISYDALSRVKVMNYPVDVENLRRRLRPEYNRAGALEKISLERVSLDGGIVSDRFVERIAYNAKGQRLLITYGNGIMTRYAYDLQTFRLLHLRTERFNKPSELAYRNNGGLQQEFAYEFDLTGNITAIHDRTPDSGLPGSPDQLDRSFSYDSLYRLLSASGRECDAPPIVPPNSPWDDLPRCVDLTRTRRYNEQYEYDVAGNILKLNHTHIRADGTSQATNRNFTLLANSNRLRKVEFGNQPFDYTYDNNGNMTGESSSRHFEWDHADRMRVYRTQTEGSEPSVHAHYLYDAGGQRVKKFVRKQGGQVEVTVYIDGVFEFQRIVRGGVIEENSTLHVMDDKSRIALLRVGQPFSGDPTPAVKYQLGDHLGSSNLVLNNTGSLLNREEYTPYGETSFGSFAQKRYRFQGKERDEETGLLYFGFRYYSSSLGRWTSPDPLTVHHREAALNLYSIVEGRVLTAIDPVGLDKDVPPVGSINGTPSAELGGTITGSSGSISSDLHKSEGTTSSSDGFPNGPSAPDVAGTVSGSNRVGSETIQQLGGTDLSSVPLPATSLLQVDEKASKNPGDGVDLGFDRPTPQSSAKNPSYLEKPSALSSLSDHPEPIPIVMTNGSAPIRRPTRSAAKQRTGVGRRRGADEDPNKNEHRNNIRGSNKGRHQKGKGRKITDKGGEKGDVRRPYSRKEELPTTNAPIQGGVYSSPPDVQRARQSEAQQRANGTLFAGFLTILFVGALYAVHFVWGG